MTQCTIAVMDGLSLTPVPAQQVASLLSSSPVSGYLIVDLRPSGQFCVGHIRGAENLNFSNILLRRLLKGVVKLEAMLTSPALIERVCRRRHTTQFILCDSSSSPASRRPELLKHAEVLVNCLRDKDSKEGMQHHGYCVQYVDGESPYPGLGLCSIAGYGTNMRAVSESKRWHMRPCLNPHSLETGCSVRATVRAAHLLRLTRDHPLGVWIVYVVMYG